MSRTNIDINNVEAMLTCMTSTAETAEYCLTAQEMDPRYGK